MFLRVSQHQPAIYLIFRILNRELRILKESKKKFFQKTVFLLHRRRPARLPCYFLGSSVAPGISAATFSKLSYPKCMVYLPRTYTLPHVGKYTIHGSYKLWNPKKSPESNFGQTRYIQRRSVSMRPSLPNASSAPCDIEKGAVLGGEKKFVGEVQGAPVTLPVFFSLIDLIGNTWKT